MARGPSVNPYQTLLSNGPIARNVEDVALFLDAMCSEDARDPLTLPLPAASFPNEARSRKKPVKVAFSPDLGITPVDPEIAEICRRAAMRFQDMGVAVDETSPDFSGVRESYGTIRAFEFSLAMSHLPGHVPEGLKPELAENLALGRALGFDDIARATRTRSAIHARVERFFRDFDLLLTPTTIVGPYPVEQRYARSCNGTGFSSYLDWLAIAYAITPVSLPALSLPCGFTRAGLPVGLQMVGRRQGEAALLSAARLLEEALALEARIIDPNDRIGSTPRQSSHA